MQYYKDAYISLSYWKYIYISLKKGVCPIGFPFFTSKDRLVTARVYRHSAFTRSADCQALLIADKNIAKMSVKTVLLEFKVIATEKEAFTQVILDALKKRNFTLNLLSSTSNKEGNFFRSIYEGLSSVLNISWIQTTRTDVNLR